MPVMEVSKVAGTVPSSSTAWIADQSVSKVNKKKDCIFKCATGRKPSGTGAGESCTLRRGFFLPTGSVASRAATTCGITPPASSTGWAPTQAGSVTGASDCVFTCATGRTASGTGSSESCGLNSGYFSASNIPNGVGTPCGSAPQDGTWDADQSGVRSTSDCKFICTVGFVKEGRTCHPRREVKSIAAGTYHTCAILGDGRVKCWGFDYFGQLGLGSNSKDRNNNIGDEPNEMGANLNSVNLGTNSVTNAPYRARSLSIENHHTCAILDDHSVKCWGRNDYGQLGLGNSKTASTYDTPQDVDLGVDRTARSLVAGWDHICAILDDDSMKCWGRNNYGQLGLGNKIDQNTPQGVDLGVNRTARSLSLGYNHTCAILDDASMKCWGRNNAGQLGLGHNDDIGDGPDEMGDSLQAVALKDPDNTPRTLVSMVAGSNHTCVRLNGNSIKCWGANIHGQLGLGNTTSYNTPQVVNVGTGHTVQSLFLGGNSTCAILDNDKIKCWGSNVGGKLGQGSGTIQNEYDEIFVDHNIGNDSGETGDNLPYVELGTNKSTSKAYRALSLALGGRHTCAILDNSRVKCWGNNESGRLGQGNKTTHIYDNKGNGTIEDNYNLGDEPNEMSDNLPFVELDPFSISSTNFNHNEVLPNDFSHNRGSAGSKQCNGKNDFPQLSWSNVPAGTKSFVLIVDDPDVPSSLGGGTWVHLNLFNIPLPTPQIPRIAATASFVAAFPSSLGTLGKNSWDQTAWGGPCPPNTGDSAADTHSYHFKIYAMSSATTTLPIPLAPLTRAEFETTYSGSILGSAEMIGEFTTTE